MIPVGKSHAASADSLRRSITVGISGSSGAVYALRLLRLLPLYYARVDVVMSNAARLVFKQETGADAPEPGVWAVPGTPAGARGEVMLWHNQNYNAPFASGSNAPEAMVIVPCSMSTAASIASGVDQNLMHHAAGVIIKEKRQLILMPRETPLSAIHLRNLLTLADLGVAVIPAMPGFYGGEETFDHLVDFVVQKVLNQLKIDLRLAKRWGE